MCEIFPKLPHSSIKQALAGNTVSEAVDLLMAEQHTEVSCSTLFRCKYV